jgi:hypothetical protein
MKIISLVLMLVVSSSLFSQQPLLTEEAYLKKSKSQKTAAWVLFGGGLGMVSGGIAINLSGGILNGNGSKGLWLSYVGGATVLSSIPLFITASKNKRKAALMSYKMEKLPVIQQQGLVNSFVPALSIRIPLSR